MYWRFLFKNRSMEILFTWETWLYLGVILMILEVFTPGFVLACIGIGAFLASVFAALNFSVEVQLLFFTVGTLLSFFGIRPFVLKYLYKSKKVTKTNADSLIGRTGLVTEKINLLEEKGRIRIDGDNWRAQSNNNVEINTGETVEVVAINSTIMIVQKINN